MQTKPRFPSIANLAAQLRDLNRNVESSFHSSDPSDQTGCEVRLQVYPEGGYRLRYGDPSYDSDHSGYWGASSIPGVVKGKAMPFNSVAIARYLINQAKEAFVLD